MALLSLKLPAASLIVVGPAPPRTLERLAATAPTPLSLDELAEVVSAEALLLYRVSQRRQSIPKQLVLPIAVALSVQTADVEGVAGSILNLGFGNNIRIGNSFRAIPPDRALGDALFLLPIAPTSTPIFG